MALVSNPRPLVDIIEALYCGEQACADWLEDVLRSIASALSSHAGVATCATIISIASNCTS